MRIGDRDLRGKGTLQMLVARIATTETIPGGFETPIVYLRADQQHEVRMELASWPSYTWMLPVILVAFASALLVGLRAEDSPAARALAIGGGLWCLLWPLSVTSDLAIYESVMRRVLIPFLSTPLLLQFYLLFPEDAPRPRPWMLRATWLGTVNGIVSGWWVWPSIIPPEIGSPGTMLLSVAINITGAAILLRNYARAGPIGRRQGKWVLFPFVLVMASFACAQLGYVGGMGPELYAAAWFSTLLLPIGIVIAILRFNLFDIDRILSATATYGTLLFLLGVGVLVLLPYLAGWLAPAVGTETTTVHIALSVALAAVILPAQKWVRPRLDAVFFRERVALERGIDALLERLGESETPKELLETAGERLNELLHPDACVIYARSGSNYSAIFVHGRGVPPTFAGESALLGALTERSRPLARERWTRAGGEGLDPFARAALETLGCEVVLPLRRGERLTGFICLGTKRSGDIYTSTDLSLLAAVSDKTSAVITRFDEAEALRQKDAMRQALRRYVPDAVASRVELGQSMEPTEREVCVLFTDIRDYTGFAEGRPSREIFEAVNRYAEKVSTIVQSHGGNLVEFEGDGIMAVFGAPNQLAAKERAALDAGREIVAAVPRLGLGREHGAGVGMATGEALVGNVQAADRLIWSAIGNTTNLAARLQGLTRHLDADIVIDTATFEAVGSAAPDFERHDHVRIRGRMLPETVYAL